MQNRSEWMETSTTAERLKVEQDSLLSVTAGSVFIHIEYVDEFLVLIVSSGYSYQDRSDTSSFF